MRNIKTDHTTINKITGKNKQTTNIYKNTYTQKLNKTHKTKPQANKQTIKHQQKSKKSYTTKQNKNK